MIAAQQMVPDNLTFPKHVAHAGKADQRLGRHKAWARKRSLQLSRPAHRNTMLARDNQIAHRSTGPQSTGFDQHRLLMPICVVQRLRPCPEPTDLLWCTIVNAHHITRPQNFDRAPALRCRNQCAGAITGRNTALVGCVLREVAGPAIVRLQRLIKPCRSHACAGQPCCGTFSASDRIPAILDELLNAA